MPKAKYKRRKDGRFGTYVQDGYLPDGRPNRISVYANSSAELEKKVSEIRYEIEHGTYIAHKDVLFGDYAKQWFETYQINNQPPTKAMYQRIIDKYLKPLHNSPLINIKKSDIQRIINQNSQHRRTCEQILLTVRQIINCAIDDGLLLRDICRKIKLPSATQDPENGRRSLTEIEKSAIDQADFTPKQRAYVAILRGCGLRPGEITALKPLDINWSENTLRVDEAITYDENNVVWKGPKSQSGYREISMPPFVVDALRAYLPTVDDIVLFPMERKGGPMTKSSRRKLWEGIMKKIREAAGETVTDTGIKNQKIFGLIQYTFRHNYCTSLYYSGVSQKEAIRLMGHSDYKLIMEVYAHLDKQKEKTEKKLAKTSF
ncbi:tyrosine-type recombinase/integrase [Hominifimenecus sp. rT4P-3]|uniref:tyrosine-type recombinase/integrase n=1 Tax=Hominifimenecus sp. rT4P-3 TaxID=3242979 RepID=UPI003DA30D36